MPATGARSRDDSQTLLELTRASLSMISHYLNSINDPSSPPRTTMADPPNPLHVLKDAALLLKSHTTKLGLLLINPPFTPSAIASVVREMTTSCIPAMLSAVGLAHPDIWSGILHGEVNARVMATLRAVEVCMTDVGALATDQSTGAVKRDPLTSTGAVWEACDALIELEDLDVGGLALHRAKQYQALIKDALDELKQWREESVGQRDEDDEDDDDAEEPERSSEDDLFGVANTIPRDRPELLLALDDALIKIKRVEILCTALCKRRVSSFTKAKARIYDHVKTMDRVLDGLKSMSETTDELAGGFYELNEDSIHENTKVLVEGARQTIDLVRLSWDGDEDEFTIWSGKWLDAMK